MKKTALGFIALAMSLMATTARADGDIRSIDPCDALGTVIPNGSVTDPYTAGDTAYFRIRLENANSEDSWNEGLANPWVFEYNGVAADPDLQWAINPPKVGVYVSGQLRAASIVSIGAPADAPWYTDIICAYTVRPGDLALPMTLANSAGKEVGDGASAQYWLETIPKTAAWKLVSYERESSVNWNTVVATNTCTFGFGESDFFGKTAITQPEMLSWTKDLNLRQAGLYLKSVDFAADEYSVAEGRTEKVTVAIEGGVNTNGNGTVYAIIRDGGAVSLAESSVETVTFANTPALDMDGTYQIAKVTIPSGADVTSFSFMVKGLTQGGEETVYLSTSKGFSYGDSSDLITNFVTAVVKCTAPPPPEIYLTFDGDKATGTTSKRVTATPDYTTSATKLTVTLSEAYTSDFTVNIGAKINNSTSTVIPVGTHIGMAPAESDVGYLMTETSVTFSASEMSAGNLTKTLYIYVKGGDDETSADGILFEAEPEAGAPATFFQQTYPAVLKIDKCTPVIVSPTEGWTYPTPIASGVDTLFKVTISDDYNNLNVKKSYSVQWNRYGELDDDPVSLNNLVPVDGVLTIPIRYNYQEAPYTSTFKITNADGSESEWRTVTVTVNPIKQVSATILEEADSRGRYSENIGELNISFTLNSRYSNGPLYAFLVPQNEASSNQVECAAFTEGVAILAGQTNSVIDAVMTILDGTTGSPFRYSIILRTTDRLDDGGSTISTYSSQDLYIPVINEAPVVTEVNMSGSAPVTVNGGTFTGKASMGLNKIFTLAADDVEADLTNDVTAVWMFSDPNGNAITREVTGPIDDIALTNVFEVAGTYSCTVKLQDKDMSSKKYGETFAFNVVVLDTPSLEITFPNSNTFNETDADKGLSYFNIELSTAATKPLEVEIECTQVGADGVLNITTNRVYFRANQMQQQVLIDELDGTANSVSFKGGFSVTAKVVTDTLNEDGIAYKDVYIPATEKMYVANEPPAIVLPFDTGATNDAAINVYIPIKWKIDDVDADRTNDLTVTWTTSEGRSQEFNGSDVFEGVFTNIFTAGGAKTVTMTVTDKDDMMSSVTLYYRVSPSKLAKVYPMGPYYGGLTALSRMYSTAAGIGEGRVWGNGGSQLVESFVHKYTYGFSDTSAEIYAWGYRNGQTDDGTLASGKDIAIRASGDSFNLGEEVSAAGCYTYTDTLGRDSFFYAWLIASKEEEATTYTGTPLISPVNPKSKNGAVQYSLALPTEQAGDDANPVFPDRFLEAFFSKELYPADNMGDMNADGIPDYFATLYWALPTGELKTIPEAMTGQAIAGSGGGDEEGEGESATASDLAKIDTYNDDLDFLPAAWTSANPLDPAIRNWGPGEPFTTRKEIRGVGIGLNEPGVSEYELTEAETAALYAACALAGAPAADYAAATNWAKSTGWTPEAINPLSGARLNPLTPDTDGDGFDDGWEYFFWYYAKIGAIVDGKWSRLEGRRFDFSAPGMSVRISPEEIAEAFDPHVVRETQVAFGTDFDNDGLSDLEEFALGTNPCDWDSDGDGAADLWEVINGLDPVSPDGENNPDCDFMAKCEYAEDTFTLFTLADGKVFALPTATAPAVVPAESASTSAFFKVEVALGKETAVYWMAEKPVTYAIDGTEFLAANADAFASLVIGETTYLGEAVTLSSGTPVTVTPDTVDMTAATLPEAGFAWSNPETLERGSTTMALEVFNYGGDGETWVPCTSNISSYVEISAGAGVVKVQEEIGITLLHDQVRNQYGFDPRVAWNINEYGFLDNRWRQADSENTGSMGEAGMPTNTVAYTSSDEFLVMQYYAKAKPGAYPELAESAGISVDLCLAYTTFANLPLDFVRGLEYSHEPFTATNGTYLAYWDTLTKNRTVHGADTDHDGIPDGWELYVGTAPLFDDADRYVGDGDKLSFVQEYAGVDSCNAYTNRFDKSGELVFPEVETVTKNNPGVNEGWWNKFFPTDPYAVDTDGDGLQDHLERDGYSGTFYVGYNIYSASFTFIYGDNAETYAADGKTICFRGGGLNPCTVDTDCDLLPDPWEYQFAGIVFEGDTASAAGLSSHDQYILLSSDAHRSVDYGDGKVQILGGMDGTFNGDACYDFDHDGLVNCQEYLVQSLRHLRYDDFLTPLMGVDPSSKNFVRFIPFSAWDGNAFHKKCLQSGFTGLGAWQFRQLGYFALPPRPWDQIALNKAGLGECANYAHSEGAGYRVMLRPSFELPLVGTIQAGGYACTDPRRWDTDNDGMGDYYELFHGLNPLLGSAADPLALNQYGLYNFQEYDVIGSIYGGNATAWQNHWAGWTNTEQPAFDAVRFPWMIGTMECDADGDGLRNDEESLKVNVADPKNTHTDPTPLWMTDSSSARFASFTSQYYGPDPYLEEVPEYDELTTHPDLFSYPWAALRWNIAYVGPGGDGSGINRNWMFSFEENEGFDTDNDFKSDAAELTKFAEPTSDPLSFADPSRRQALYLDGVRSAAVSYDTESRRAVGTEPDLLKQFTVECWIRPDAAGQNAVIVERVCKYGASTLSNNTGCVRANFRIGLADGHLYGEYEGSTVDSGKVRVEDREHIVSTEKWTHVAFTYDGYTAALYVDGENVPVDTVIGAGILPANGIDGILQNSGAGTVPYTGYRALPCSMVIGAKAATIGSVPVTPDTSWNDYSSFYKGWIDEVRIWDGARTPVQIGEAHMLRYTMADVEALRETVYKAWKDGARRASGNLPAELLMHYNFVTLPGAVDSAQVITEPVGFSAGVRDNVRKPNGKYRDLDESLKVGWWSDLGKIKSTVYSSDWVVPWIGNTVAHLPIMDGSVADSRYWTEYSAGLIGVPYLPLFGSEYMNCTRYDFPNSANPYPYYVRRLESYYHMLDLNFAPFLAFVNDSGIGDGTYADGGTDPMRTRYEFQLRSDFIGTTDLIPLGGAFAKRRSDFWDGDGAMDAWSYTVTAKGETVDSDGDGIPDWADPNPFEKDDEAEIRKYLDKLASGWLPGAVTNDPVFAVTSDSNADGLEDWWQDKYDLKGDARLDTDRDGLADYAEYLAYLLGFVDEELNPTLSKTDGKEFDYFRKSGPLYFGEMFSDHDFIEDWWENRYAKTVANSSVYDPAADSDADGWSNYAERRAGTAPDRTATITADAQQIPEYPEPLISVKAYYRNASAVSAPIVVKAYSGSDLSVLNATWSIPGSDVAMNYERVIGVNPLAKTKYTLGPCVVVPGSVEVFFKDPAELNVVDGSGTWSPPAASTWRDGLREKPIAGNNEMANLCAGSEPVGTVVYNSGEAEIDFTSSLLGGHVYYVNADTKENVDAGAYSFYMPATNTYTRINLKQSYFKLLWQSKRIAYESMWRFALPRATSGYVREGLNTFVAFVDLDGNGEYTTGEPMGVTRNVDIGWSGTELEICIDDNNDSRVALDLPNDETSLTRMSTVNIRRYSIDGQHGSGSYQIVNPNIRTFSIGSRNYLHDADYLSDGEFDIDWSRFQDDVMKSSLVTAYPLTIPVTSVVYRVTVNAGESSSNTFDIVRTFTINQLVPVPVNANTVNYGARPVFSWTFDQPGAETYTAFSVRILDSKGAQVWNSGIRPMPPHISGVYSWTAPVSVNDLLSAGNTFLNAIGYQWQVSVHNAKFQSAKWSAAQGFTMHVPDPAQLGETNYIGCGAINVKVKYRGPVVPAESIASLQGVVRVEAFTTPDFTGVPAARTYVTGVTGENGGTAWLIGLDDGTYYVRAFIDSDGDNVRSDWESWGYACLRGDITTDSIYDPARVTVSNGKRSSVSLYIEDTDCDQDCLPDAWEYVQWTADNGGYAVDAFLNRTGTKNLELNSGLISLNTALQAKVARLSMYGASAGMLSLSSGGVSSQFAALALGVPTLENSIEESTLAIRSIALDSGDVKLTVAASAEEPAVGTVFVSDGTVTATIVVYYSDTLDGAWSSKEITKTFTIDDDAVSDELSFSLSELGLDSSKGFFKVELKQ